MAAKIIKHRDGRESTVQTFHETQQRVTALTAEFQSLAGKNDEKSLKRRAEVAKDLEQANKDHSSAAEIRVTVLANKKRVDLHFFEVPGAGVDSLTVGDLLSIASSDAHQDAAKIEIGPGNASELPRRITGLTLAHERQS